MQMIPMTMPTMPLANGADTMTATMVPIYPGGNPFMTPPHSCHHKTCGCKKEKKKKKKKKKKDESDSDSDAEDSDSGSEYFYVRKGAQLPDGKLCLTFPLAYMPYELVLLDL